MSAKMKISDKCKHLRNNADFIYRFSDTQQWDTR